MKIVVYGEPQPGGSKKAYVNPKNGKAIVTDANAKAKPWRERVAQAAGEQYDGPLLGEPLDVRLTFYRPRPKGHFGTGRNEGVLKESAPAYPATRPDALKLARAVEDALSGVIYRDDAQIVNEELRKRYGEPARCEIEVWLSEFIDSPSSTTTPPTQGGDR